MPLGWLNLHPAPNLHRPVLTQNTHSGSPGRSGYSTESAAISAAAALFAALTFAGAAIELDARAGTVCFSHNGRALGDPHVAPAAGGAAWPSSAVAAHGAPGSHAIEREPAAVEPDVISPAGVAFTGVPADVVFCVEIKEGGCQILSYC